MARRRRDGPCERCGWIYEGMHICFDASKRCEGEGVIDPKPKRRSGTGPSRANRAAVTGHWEDYRAQNRERDHTLVADYISGEGILDLRKKYGIAHATVVKIIRRAEAETETSIMRSRGHNLRWQRGAEDAAEA